MALFVIIGNYRKGSPSKTNFRMAVTRPEQPPGVVVRREQEPLRVFSSVGCHLLCDLRLLHRHSHSLIVG
jgi:hypothetical protein